MNICEECKAECTPKMIDLGIGPYEFWGAKGYHTASTVVSDCCEAAVIDENGADVTSIHDESDRADYEYECELDRRLNSMD